MTATITLPDYLVQQLQRRATVEHRSVESLAIACIEAKLTEDAAPQIEPAPASLNDDGELLALIARIKATPPNPTNIIPAKGNLADVLRSLEAMKMEEGYDLDAQVAALDAAEAELRAINRAV